MSLVLSFLSKRHRLCRWVLAFCGKEQAPCSSCSFRLGGLPNFETGGPVAQQREARTDDDFLMRPASSIGTFHCLA